MEQKLLQQPKKRIKWFLVILFVIILFGLIVFIIIFRYPPERPPERTDILVDGKTEKLSGITLPIEENESISIVRQFCEPKYPSYQYYYEGIKKVNHEWQIMIPNMNNVCSTTVNETTGETKCQVCVISANETADWKTYRNEEYEFEIKYPTNWEATYYWRGGPTKSTEFIVQDATLLNIGYIPLDEFKTLGIPYCEAFPEDEKSCKEIFINNNKYIINETLNNKYVVNETLNDELVLLIENARSNVELEFVLKSKTDEIKTIFIEMLSTFKFIEDETTNCLKKYPLVEFKDCVPGKIVDGWSGIVLYPNTLDTSNITHYIDAPAPDVVKQASIASYTTSSATCQTIWQIRINGEWKEVNQLDFCNFIIDYNNSCNGCLLEWKEGCC